MVLHKFHNFYQHINQHNEYEYQYNQYEFKYIKFDIKKHEYND